MKWYEWVWGPRKIQCRVFRERREVLLLQREHSHAREREHSHVRSALGLYFECRGVLCLSRAGQSAALLLGAKTATLESRTQFSTHPFIEFEPRSSGLVARAFTRGAILPALCFQLFIGFGFPYEGPAPLEAIANGCIFLQSRFSPPHSSLNHEFFRGKPTSREVSRRAGSGNLRRGSRALGCREGRDQGGCVSQGQLQAEAATCWSRAGVLPASLRRELHRQASRVDCRL